MHDMTEMEMPLPDNTAPMMTGQGPMGAIGMGGMFSVLKVRRDQKPGDYADPGWFRHPPGTVAFEWTGPLADAARPRAEPTPVAARRRDVEVRIRKPNGHSGH
jgi:hypothetical protein